MFCVTADYYFCKLNFQVEEFPSTWSFRWAHQNKSLHETRVAHEVFTFMLLMGLHLKGGTILEASIEDRKISVEHKL
jgi:hypothetical protein